MKPTFHVTWEIDLYADTPQDAAQLAWDMLQGQGSTCTVFEVFDEDGNKTCVDLLEDEE
jgi:hypothetical protein